MKKLTIKELFLLSNEDRLEYDIFYKSLNHKDTFLGKPNLLNSLSYNEVKALFKLITNYNEKANITKTFCIVFGIEQEFFLNADASEFYACIKIVRASVESLMLNEKMILQRAETKNSAIWRSAAGDTLKPFNDLSPLVMLGAKFSIYPFDLGKKKYTQILSLLAFEAKQSDVEIKFNEMLK